MEAREAGVRSWVAGVSVVLMAAGPAVAAGPAGAESCTGCHVKGGSMGQVVGRPAEDLLRSLEAYRTGPMQGSLMGRIVRGFSPSEVRELASWFSKQ